MFKKKRARLVSLTLFFCMLFQVPIISKAAEAQTLDVSVNYEYQKNGYTYNSGESVVVNYTGHLNVFSFSYMKSDSYKTFNFGPVIFSDQTFNVIRRGSCSEAANWDSSHSVFYYFYGSSFSSKDASITKLSGYRTYELPDDQNYNDVYKWFIDSGLVDVSKDQLSNDPMTPDPDDPEWYKQLLDKLRGWLGGILEPFADALLVMANALKDLQDFGISLLPQKIQDIYNFLYELLEDKLRTWFEDLQDLVVKIKDFISNIYSKIYAIWNWCMGLSVKLVTNELTEPFFQWCRDRLEWIWSKVDYIGAHLNDAVPSIEDFRSWLDNTELGSFLKDAKLKLADIAQINKDLLDGIKNGFVDFSFSEIWEALGDYVKEWFVPSESYMDSFKIKISGVYDATDKLKEGGNYILNFMKNSASAAPPVITVNLAKSTSYNLGDSVIIDFSWYAPYKPTVDVLLAGIIWATFLWNIFKRLPEIVSGVGMISSGGGD